MSRARVDVLVVGFGLAGASAALAAEAAGAHVLVVEKTGAGGGNCRHSGGFLFQIDGPDAVGHLDALCFGKTDRDVLAAYAAGVAEVPGWLEALGGRASHVDMAAFGGMLPSWPHFPGAGHVGYRQFSGEGGGADERPGIALWRLVERTVRSRGIEVRLGCAVVDLLVDEGGVRGAVLADGTEIEATGGVVLASGGLEYDAELRDAFLPLPLVPVGHPGNTGDSVRLTQRAGGSLWHMSAFFGWLSFRAPGFDAAFTLDVHAPSFIYVDADGRRFADETGWEVHDKVRCWTAFLPRNANAPRLPGYIVFDEVARLAGPLHGIVGTPNDYAWSADNSAEVGRGWITRAGSASELAAVLGLSSLAETLAAYGSAVRAGRDDLFGRAAPSLVALEPPLYAIEIWPGLATASGGPRRDARARVLASGASGTSSASGSAAAAGGDPIPGLYACGAAGSIWGHLTEHGGGLTDAIVFGRIAGAEAAERARAGHSAAST
jgi:succinate dehydrogenase/fumarate reductase flavoprotein subunit